jgi:hypothetical protein
MQFNFIGRLLGPRGHSLKRIEATTGCRVFIRGKGSIKDPVKVNKFLFSQDGSSIMLFVVFYNFHWIIMNHYRLIFSGNQLILILISDTPLVGASKQCWHAILSVSCRRNSSREDLAMNTWMIQHISWLRPNYLLMLLMLDWHKHRRY